jgi:hypothetical protein
MKIEDVFELQEDEKLYFRLSVKRVLDIINNESVEIRCFKQDTNDYGEFYYLYLSHTDIPGEILILYNFGYNEICGIYKYKTFSYYYGEILNSDNECLDKEKIKQVIGRLENYYADLDRKQTDHNKIYNEEEING